MKLDMKAGSRETTTQVDGLSITLHSLDPQVAKARVAQAAEPRPLGELLVSKLPPYVIGPQDILLVTVWDHPEITLPLGQFRTDAATGTVVDEDGFLYFPYIGRISVKGQTTSQVRESLTTQLAKVLQRPQVDVKVLAYRSQKIYIGGEVKAPAVYNVTDVPFTLAEAVNRAGGFLPTADDSRVILTRGDKTWRLDFLTLMREGNRIGQILLKDGDSLYVPNTLEDPVYLMGEVVKPGTMPLVHGNLSLAKALSDVGGIQGGSADARSIYVIRQGIAAKAVDVYHLDARNPAAMVLADQFSLLPRDIVYVDAGTLVRFSRVMNMLLPTVSAITTSAVAGAEVHYFYKTLK
jgi:polysaccharide export outer membrane protein